MYDIPYILGLIDSQYSSGASYSNSCVKVSRTTTSVPSNEIVLGAYVFGRQFLTLDISGENKSPNSLLVGIRLVAAANPLTVLEVGRTGKRKQLKLESTSRLGP